MGSGCFGHKFKNRNLITAALAAAFIFAMFGEGLRAQDRSSDPLSPSVMHKLKYIDAAKAKILLSSPAQIEVRFSNVPEVEKGPHISDAASYLRTPPSAPTARASPSENPVTDSRPVAVNDGASNQSVPS